MLFLPFSPTPCVKNIKIDTVSFIEKWKTRAKIIDKNQMLLE
jgi:hypothetical protein